MWVISLVKSVLVQYFIFNTSDLNLQRVTGHRHLVSPHWCRYLAHTRLQLNQHPASTSSPSHFPPTHSSPPPLPMSSTRDFHSPTSAQPTMSILTSSPFVIPIISWSIFVLQKLPLSPHGKGFLSPPIRCPDIADQNHHRPPTHSPTFLHVKIKAN